VRVAQHFSAGLTDPSPSQWRRRGWTGEGHEFSRPYGTQFYGLEFRDPALKCWANFILPLTGQMLATLLFCITLVPASAAPTSDDSKAGATERHPAARCVSVTAAMVRRQAPGQPWQVVNKDETLHTGDSLVGTTGASLDSINGAVHLSFRTDLSGESPYPVIEAGVVLHQSHGADLDFTLERGRVDLQNRKQSGAATVRVHVRDQTWDLVLQEPGSSIALELYGRWPRGVAFTKSPGPKDVPTADLVFLVLIGNVTLKHEGCEHALKAPPGPALMEWDSVSGEDETPHYLEKPPPWADARFNDSPAIKARKARAERFRQMALTKSLDSAIEELLKSDDPGDRRLAVCAMGALDNLEGLGKALREAKHPDVWENGVLVLRHWIGRGPGQDQRLYKAFIEIAKYSPVDAETVLQLLHSYGEEDLARPELYETLIDYLGHDKLAVRGLAYWHLVRLVPAGKDFGYNPQDSKESRDAAIQKWKKLIPAGQMPPRAKPAARK
jgi:hypothetical protein